MRQSQTLTFGGSELDRAAHLRADPAKQESLFREGKILPIWRGKILMGLDSALSWVDAGHPVVRTAESVVFLGLDNGSPCFAADISAWQPAGVPIPQPPLFLDPSEQQHPDLPKEHLFCELRAVMLRLSAVEAELAATARAILQWHKSHGFCAACGQASDIVQAGWQRSCPSCKTQHFPRTDPVVIMLVTKGNAALMGRSPGWPEGMYSCLAGFIEPGETIEAAVRREVFEEAGIRIGTVNYVASQPWPFPASLMLGCKAEAISEDIQVDPAELEDARWVSREEMVTVLAGLHPMMKPARKGAIAHFLIENWLADRLD
ncbi:NAD(+) diphosphatase [Thioclava sp. FR2]|uniref:NAD(+) diphosphatase n=1 Tax=Thioclava sp. FR2 TaxID=3445780 RepID=UPI003EBA0C6A